MNSPQMVSLRTQIGNAVLKVPGLLGVFVAALVINVRADVLVSYTVSSTHTGDSELPYSNVLSGVSATTISGAGGLLGVGLQGQAQAFGALVQGADVVPIGDPSGWPLLDFDTEALGLTLTPPAGFQIRFTSIDWTFGAFSNSMEIQIRTSLDNFSASIDGGTIPSGFAGAGPTPLTSLPLINNSITFRWYAYSYGDADTMRPFGGFVDTSGVAVRFNGTLVPLPKITSLQRTSPGGQVQVHGTGAPSVMYNVQETASLLTAPQTVTTTSGDASGNFQYSETPPNGTTRRFYRFQQQ